MYFWGDLLKMRGFPERRPGSSRCWDTSANGNMCTGSLRPCPPNTFQVDIDQALIMSSTLHSLFLWHLYLSPRLFLTVRLKRWWAQWFGWNLFCQHQTIFNHFFNSFLSLKKALQPSQTKASKCFPLDWSPQIAHRGFMLTMDTITSHATLETRSMCISSFKDLSKVVHWIAKGRDHPTHETERDQVITSITLLEKTKNLTS